MIAPIIRWLAPPILPSHDRTRRARALWMLAWSFFVVLTLVLALAVAADPETLARRATTILAVGALVALLHELSRRGRTELASWVFVIGLTIILTERAWHTGGIHAPVSMFYILFALMGGALLGSRGGRVTAAACLASAVFLSAAELGGWIAVPAGSASVAAAFLSPVFAIGLTLVIQNLLLQQARRAASDDLIQMFVHDMRSPLTVVMGRLAMLREDTGADTQAAEHVNAAFGDALRLSQLANNFLDIHRFDAGSIPIQRRPSDIARIARDVVHALGALEPTLQVEVRAEAPVVYPGDAELLRRVIENLVSNAMKHTPPKGRLRVDVAATPACVRIAVQDEGPGVPTEARERIFERFSATGLSTGSGQHSVGLGLAFCKYAVEAHGGTIRVEGALPRGSTFIVELPVA